jgi:hypothetical protein
VTVRRPRLLAAAAATLALALFLGVLGVDVLRWRGHLERADMRFAAGSGDRSMWEAPGIVPFDAARRLLGVDDDVSFRRALQGFRLSRPTLAPRDQHDVAVRAEAAFALARVARTDPSPERRSIAVMLEGALAFEQARNEQTDAQVYLGRSIDAFRRAITLDPSNEAAKYDLELVLTLIRQVQQESRGSGRSPRSGGQPGQGAGAGSRGGGF